MSAIAAMVGLTCFVTAILDMGMNGARYAGWAPWGIGVALVCFGGLRLAGIR